MDTKKINDFVRPASSSTNDSAGSPAVPQIDFTASTAIVHSGFIAQEVEQAAQAVGFINSIVCTPSNDKDLYALNYGEFVVPLVKAVQELSTTTDSLKAVTHKQDSLINALQNQINGCCAANGANNRNTTQATTSINSTQSTGSSDSVTNNGQLTNAILYQNTPNPFSQTTVVKCFVPQSSQNVSLLVFDMNGSLKKTITITDKGTVNTTINGNQLVPGMYYYTLLIDGQEIDTKKMILTE